MTDELTKNDSETPLVHETTDCPVCGHPMGKHEFLPMEIFPDTEESVMGSAIHCNVPNCQLAVIEGEACFVQNFLEVLEDHDEDD